MRVERAIRAVLIAAGGALLITGLWKMHYRQPLTRIIAWAVVPAVLHDAVIAPVAVALGWVGTRVLPGWLRRPVLVGALASLALALVGWSVVTRTGARDDNPSLLPRNYWHSELILLAAVWACVAVAALVARRRLAGEQPTGPRT